MGGEAGEREGEEGGEEEESVHQGQEDHQPDTASEIYFILFDYLLDWD